MEQSQHEDARILEANTSETSPSERTLPGWRLTDTEAEMLDSRPAAVPELASARHELVYEGAVADGEVAKNPEHTINCPGRWSYEGSW